MPNKVTVTGKVGPDLSLTTKVFDNLNSISFNFDSQVILIDYIDSNNIPSIVQVDLFGVTTVTYSISGHIATLVVS